MDLGVLGRWYDQVLRHRCMQGGIMKDPEGAPGWEFAFYHPYWDRGGGDRGGLAIE